MQLLTMSRKPLNYCTSRNLRLLVSQEYERQLLQISNEQSDHVEQASEYLVEQQQSPNITNDTFQFPMFIDQGMKDDSNTITISTEYNIYIDDNPAVDIQNENNDISSEIKNWALTENVTATQVAHRCS